MTEPRFVVSAKVPVYFVPAMDAIVEKAGLPDRSTLIRRAVHMVIVASPVGREALQNAVEKMRADGTLNASPEELRLWLPGTR